MKRQITSNFRFNNNDLNKNTTSPQNQSSIPIVSAEPVVSDLIYKSKIGIQIPYLADDEVYSTPTGTDTVLGCTSTSGFNSTGAPCTNNQLIPNRGSESIVIKSKTQSDTISITTSDVSTFNAQVCTEDIAETHPYYTTLTVGGQTIYDITMGDYDTYCAQTPQYTAVLQRKNSTVPQIDMSKIIFP